MVILLVAIGDHSKLNYHRLLMVISVYSINGYWWIKESYPLLVQIMFFSWIQSLRQLNMSKGLNLVICGSIKTFYAICRQGANLNPFHLKC